MLCLFIVTQFEILRPNSSGNTFFNDCAYLHQMSKLKISYLYFFIIIQFNVLFKIISLIETSQSIGGAKREYLGKTT